MAGTGDIIVSTPAGTSVHATADLFEVAPPAPAISSLSAASGFSSGGDAITIQGSNLSDATGVFFGSVAATSFTLNADGSITAVSPSQASGTVDVRVETPAGTTGVVAADRFIDTPAGAAPVVTGLSATSGSSAGGQPVTISGSNFTDVSAVNFGSQPATLFYVVSPTSIVALSPSAAAGPVNVTVITPAGTSAPGTGTSFPSDPGSGSSGGGSSGSGDSGSGSGSGSSGSSGDPTSSYVVVPWFSGPQAANLSLPYLAGMGNTLLMSIPPSPSAPPNPGKPSLRVGRRRLVRRLQQLLVDDDRRRHEGHVRLGRRPDAVRRHAGHLHVRHDDLHLCRVGKQYQRHQLR